MLNTDNDFTVLPEATETDALFRLQQNVFSLMDYRGYELSEKDREMMNETDYDRLVEMKDVFEEEIRNKREK